MWSKIIPDENFIQLQGKKIHHQFVRFPEKIRTKFISTKLVNIKINYNGREIFKSLLREAFCFKLKKKIYFHMKEYFDRRKDL